MKPVRLVPGARSELRAAAVWYETRDEGLGDEFVTEVDRTLARVAESPGRHPAWRPDRPYRQVQVTRFPYLVLYEERDDEVRVYAVAHVRRKPGYWLRRVRPSTETG